MSLPVYRLVVISEAQEEASANTALIGRDIRSRPQDIARFCLTDHRGVSEDIATVAESIALADRIFPRHRGVSWARVIELQVPVFELGTFQRNEVLESLTDAVHFLTGDTWHISFVKRQGQPLTQQTLPFEKVTFQYVVPYSDGLDSFAQTKLLEKEAGEQAVLKLRSARIGQDSKELQRPVLRVPRHLGPKRKPEQTYRSRPLVFFSFAGIGAFVSDAEAVVIGESGQGALGPAMVRYADEWPFRSTHPGFVSRLSKYLSMVLGRDLEFRLPQLWRTKGDVLRQLVDAALLAGWDQTKSCSVRPNSRHGNPVCGICGGCVLRSLATSAAGLDWVLPNTAFRLSDGASVAADGKAMTLAERHMIVRSLGTMLEFARLADSPRRQYLIETESMLFNDPDSPRVAANLCDLVNRHRAEWLSFVKRLPEGGWARTIIDLL